MQPCPPALAPRRAARAHSRRGPGRPTEDLRVRERIVEAATGLFAEQGFSATSLRAIGREVGITPPSLLHYFPTKEALYAEVLTRVAQSFERWAGEREEEGGTCPEERIVSLVDSYLAWTRGHDAYARIILRELMDNVSRSTRAKRWFLGPIVRRCAERVREAQAAGALGPFDPELFVFQFVGSVAYVHVGAPTIRRILDRPGAHDPMEEFRVELLANVRAMLRGHRTAPEKS